MHPLSQPVCLPATNSPVILLPVILHPTSSSCQCHLTPTPASHFSLLGLSLDCHLSLLSVCCLFQILAAWLCHVAHLCLNPATPTFPAVTSLFLTPASPDLLAAQPLLQHSALFSVSDWKQSIKLNTLCTCHV